MTERNEKPAVGRGAGAAAGGLGGAAAGATVGTVTAGPIGTIVGAIVGAVGGGWAGLSAGGTTSYDATRDDEFRAHYDESEHRLADRSYEHLRPAYQLGHLAAANADYRGRDFDAVERDLQHGWLDELRRTHADWETARHFARHAFDRARGGDATARATAPLGYAATDADIGETESHQRASFADPIPPGDPEHVSGDTGQQIPGRDDVVE